MKAFFSEDNKILGFLSGLVDVMFVGFLWFMFSLPLITIGASTTATYYTVVKGIRRKRGYIWKNFWTSFKMNFLPATALWIASILLDGLLVFGIVYTHSYFEGLGAMTLTIICIIILVVLLLAQMYIFPVLSRFKMSVKEIARTSFLLGIKHLPVSILCIIIFAANIAAIYFSIFDNPLAMLFMGSVFNWIYSFPMERILKKYVPAYDEENHTCDQWYAE